VGKLVLVDLYFILFTTLFVEIVVLKFNSCF